MRKIVLMKGMFFLQSKLFFKKKNFKQWVIYCILLLIIINTIMFCVSQSYSHVLDVKEVVSVGDPNDAKYATIYANGNAIHQYFIAPCEKLSYIQFKVNSIVDNGMGKITMRLKNVDDNELVSEWIIDTYNIHDNSEVYVNCEDIASQLNIGRCYQIEISMSGNGRLTVPLTSTDMYKYGFTIINNITDENDLFLKIVEIDSELKKTYTSIWLRVYLLVFFIILLLYDKDNKLITA